MITASIRSKCVLLIFITSIETYRGVAYKKFVDMNGVKSSIPNDYWNKKKKLRDQQ
ncbi:MAG: hypothetical protein SCAL_000912 [Candidatus Syntrophoarchaeum caldarius]|uniref:Uncharacterized protein n=1 Tax=Candidatus Syntropharchaeum caldarium TaxID=1838285 RepID=A0A1F2PBJ2_9EURY|nr:MAG: hypothetical protein SCAL_000912 [Candidatus Syntrophoarchaeum caldarius]